MIPVPFYLKLEDSSEVLCCTKIVRIMPGKRIVAMGTWGEKTVVAKLFLDPKHQIRHLRTDYTGVQALLTQNILTPQLYYKGAVNEQRIQVLIFERIWHAVSLADICQEKTDAQKYQRILEAVILELATQHVLGILQHDLHFKNFLMAGKKIYTIDGGQIAQQSSPLPKKQSLQNLALFFSQLGAGSESLQQTLFQAYAQARGWVPKKQEVAQLVKATRQWQKKRWKKEQNKIMRDCTQFAALKKPHTEIMYDRQYESPELIELLKNPDAIFKHPDTKILKAGGSTTVAKFSLNNQQIVVKRYNIKSIFQFLRRSLLSTRAKKSWRFANYLRFFAIPTAQPIAFIENRVFGLSGRSYFFMEFQNGIDALTFFNTHEPNEDNFILVAKRLLILYEKLSSLFITHGDLKMTNMIIHELEPLLIDLDSMRQHYFNFDYLRSFTKDVRRLMKNLDDKPAQTDRFMKLMQTFPGFKESVAKIL